MNKDIRSISELILNLQTDLHGFHEDVWFRGHSCFDWQLLPGLYRKDTEISETSLLTRFKQSASLLISIAPKDDFDWLFLMQHYGVPTRLLDWSESPLTSLYFAISEEENDDKDSALWLLKPTELNKLAHIATEEKNFIPSFDDEYLENYSIQNINSNKRVEMSPIATIATRNNSRIQAQLGVFTIHHLKKKPLEELCAQNEIIKYRIPKDSKTSLRKELELLSVNKFSLFPELASIGEILNKKLS
ncbi:FRG domain-containing protein [uncultured Sphingobacterium sp.]|uniref:FRG domain-containing protein n=1 Tax=uncultured Sphingobacterium sp. TaxID=182688 RepID=UPI0025D3A983|nr:FRG domain-containing protein [uncultured Sphingobacterium sp.]